jgi:hypothetical protein
LTNQQTGTTAAKYLSDVGSQNINTNMNVGIEQMNSPYRNVSNYANLLNSTQVPTKTTSQVQYSPLTMLTTLGTAGKGALDSLTSLYGTAAGKTILDKIGIGSLFDKSSGSGSGSGLDQNLTAGTYPLEGGGTMVINSDGTRTINQADGTTSNYDSTGNLINNADSSQVRQDQQVVADQGDAYGSTDAISGTDAITGP